MATFSREKPVAVDWRARRPVSPHLQVYRFTVTMTMSILHRLTGAALYVGMLIPAAWLLAAAAGPAWFDPVQGFFASWFGRLILFGYTWALMHHMLGGVRHLIWDTGAGLTLDWVDRLAWATVVGSVGLTVLLWLAAWAMGAL